MSVRGVHAARMRGWGLLGLAAGGALALAVTACGSRPAIPGGAGAPAAGTASAAQTGHPAVTPTVTPAAPAVPAHGAALLCTAVPTVTRLVVSRVAIIPQSHLRPAQPAGTPVTTPAQARAVAQALCGLPLMPSGVWNCPNDRGVDYRLSFAAGSRGFPLVSIDPGGCTVVTGLGSPRTAKDAPGFWRVLYRALGGSPAVAVTPQGPQSG